jgi:PAS domain S-box-containing protein
MSLDMIADRINALICTTSGDGHFTYLNPHWQKVLGWSSEEIMAKPFIEHVHPDDRELTAKAFQQILCGEGVSNLRNRCSTRSGDYVWLQWFATLLPDGGVAASAHQIDDVVIIENTLKQHAVLLEQVSLLGHMGHWSVNFETKKVLWSKEIYDIHGVTPEEYTPELASVINFYHPDDIPKVNEYVNNALAKGEGWAFTVRLVRPNGEIRIVRSLAEIPKGIKGKPVTLFGVFQDVTDYEALNRQVELLSHVANTSNAGVVICDNQRKVVWVNTAFTSLTGYVLDEVMGKGLGALLQGPNTDKNTVQQIGKELAEGKDVSVEILNYHKNDSEYWNNLLLSAVKDSRGNITHFVGIQNDITEKKRQEQMTIKSQRLDAIGQLSGGICHDFNNILGILSSNMDVLRIKNKDAGLDTLLSSMETAILRGSAVTSRLLKLTKQQSEVAEVVDVDHELASAVEMLAQTVHKNIVISASFHSGKTAFIHKDALIDAVINLIINAQHAIEHHGDIVVSSHNVETFNYGKEEVLIIEPKAAHSYIQISVRDTGCGIPQENITKIFDSLFSTRGHETGTGLGLNILMELVKHEVLGLTVQSQVGVGTNFNLWLPEAIDKRPIKEDTAIKTNNIAGLKIVFIDDEISLLDVISSYLESVGAIMTCFSNAEEALSYIDTHHTSIDLVITDNNMPGSVQGQDIYRHVTQSYTGLSCLVMTGFAGDVSSYAPDADILQKPIRLMQLKNVIADSFKRATKID